MFQGFIDWDSIASNEIVPGVRIRTPFGEHVMLSLVEIDEDALVPMHEHPHEQAGMLLEGEMELTIGEEARRLHPGDAYIIPGGTLHAARAVGGPCRALDVFSPVREDYARIQVQGTGNKEQARK